MSFHLGNIRKQKSNFEQATRLTTNAACQRNVFSVNGRIYFDHFLKRRLKYYFKSPGKIL